MMKPRTDEQIFEDFITGLGCPNVHDIHLGLKGIKEAYERAPIYGYHEDGSCNLAHFVKSVPESHYEIWVYRNGTIRVIIDASSKGGLNVEEFTDVIFVIAQQEIFRLATRPVLMGEFEVIGEPHFNVDTSIAGYKMPFHTMTLKTLTGVLLRAYQKKLADGSDVMRAEMIGAPQKVENILGVLKGGSQVFNLISEQREFIAMMMKSYLDLKAEITESLQSSNRIFPTKPPIDTRQTDHGPGITKKESVSAQMMEELGIGSGSPKPEDSAALTTAAGSIADSASPRTGISTEMTRSGGYGPDPINSRETLLEVPPPGRPRTCRFCFLDAMNECAKCLATRPATRFGKLDAKTKYLGEVPEEFLEVLGSGKEDLICRNHYENCPFYGDKK